MTTSTNGITDEYGNSIAGKTIYVFSGYDESMENNEGGFGISTVSELQMVDEIITTGTPTGTITPDGDVNFYLMNNIDVTVTSG